MDKGHKSISGAYGAGGMKPTAGKSLEGNTKTSPSSRLTQHSHTTEKMSHKTKDGAKLPNPKTENC